jgi:hypothetical protein
MEIVNSNYKFLKNKAGKILLKASLLEQTVLVLYPENY